MCLDAFTQAVESGTQTTMSPPATVSPNHDPRRSFLLQNAEATLKAVLPARLLATVLEYIKDSSTEQLDVMDRDLDDLDYGGSL